jgi:VanZ family protein
MPRPLAPGLALMTARLLFGAAVLVIAYGCFAPASVGADSFIPWDKAAHFIAFYGLEFLGLFAFPLGPRWRLALMLSAAGALIELIQATPLVGRDADVFDWVADSLGVLAALAPLAADWWRTRLARVT